MSAEPSKPAADKGGKSERPRLERIGTIADVAGRPVPVDQDALNRKP